MEEEELKKNKPSATMYVLLFIFYSIWIVQAFNSIAFYLTFGFDDFNDYGLREWLFIPLFCFGGLLCLYSVIKVLRGDRDCITALKWALMYSFLYTFFNTSRTQIPTYSLVVFLTIFLVRPLFYLGFYLYLCFSNGIKRRYPRIERSFAPSGWIWVSVTVCLLGFVSWGVYDIYKMNQFCQRVDVQELLLEEGRISDGYVSFKSGLPWAPTSKDQIDTIYVNDDDDFCLRTMEAVDDHHSIILFSGRSEKKDIRTHNRILARVLGRFDADIDETCHYDSLSFDKRTIWTSFGIKTSEEQTTLTVVTIFDTFSPKCIIFTSRFEGDCNYYWLDDILSSLEWDLQNIPKAKHEKNGDDNENDVSDRTGQNYNNAYPNMLGCLLEGRTPRFFFCEMLLEHHKRKIACGHDKNQFYY